MIVTFATYIQSPCRINYNDFDDPLIFILAPTAGQHFFTNSVKYLNTYDVLHLALSCAWVQPHSCSSLICCWPDSNLTGTEVWYTNGLSAY